MDQGLCWLDPQNYLYFWEFCMNFNDREKDIDISILQQV